MSMLEGEELMERREGESTMERERNGRVFALTIYCFCGQTQRLTIRQQQQKSNKQQPLFSPAIVNGPWVDNH